MVAAEVKGSRMREGQAGERVALLVEGPSKSDELSGICMRRNPSYGGAFAGVGPTIRLTWTEVRRSGLAAFSEIWALPIDAGPNTDFHDRKGSLRRRKAVVLRLAEDELVVSARGRGPRDASRQYESRYDVPLESEELEGILREAFSHAGPL